MQMGEIILASSDDGGIDDAVADHLDGAVECDQRARAGCGDGIAGPHEPIPVADEAAAAQLSLPRSVVSSGALRPDFTSRSMALSDPA
jgi:hypothetical protein